MIFFKKDLGTGLDKYLITDLDLDFYHNPNRKYRNKSLIFFSNKRKKNKDEDQQGSNKTKTLPDFDDEDFGPLTEKVEKIQEQKKI